MCVRGCHIENIKGAGDATLQKTKKTQSHKGIGLCHTKALVFYFSPFITMEMSLYSFILTEILISLWVLKIL
ncbi:hypothetical protein BKH46_07975 [Helicobacter sp. 12S02634-8]|nr:hypothetical protein BKH46_07975 [Helicobacter sp. 12S02634-8]